MVQGSPNLEGVSGALLACEIGVEDLAHGKRLSQCSLIGNRVSAATNDLSEIFGLALASASIRRAFRWSRGAAYLPLSGTCKDSS